MTSSSCNLVCTDSAGEPVCDSLLVSDKRSKRQADRLAQDDSLAELFTNSNFSASASYMFPKICWLSEHEPTVFAETETFGSSNSFLTRRFTGRSVTDYLDAEKFYYDRDAGYPDELLDRLGLDSEQLPDVVQVGTDIGPIDDSVADELGLPSDIRFVVTTYDALAAFWGSGPTEEGDGTNVCGTCSSLRTAMPGTASLDLSGSTIKAQRFARPDILAVGGSNSIEGGLLEWVKSTLYPDEKQGEELFDTMEAEARESSLGAGGVVFLPYLLGERAPFDDPDARGMFFGLERKHGREDLVRAVFESIGFLTRHMVSEIERSNATVETLEAAGGLTRRNFACQIKADVTGKPVLLVEELENTALGCMIITASQAREEDMQSIANEVVDYSRRFEPDPDRHEKYSELYDLFRELYESNKENFKRRADLIERLDEDETGSDRQL
ncbi:hypothetical protein GRX03_05165 [Halovenus sp. WSH3]|uniref:Carbohydrate kinase n=1 Tax=Halovenus carboxidivorans TaxID=2692199 RepID=A0A6B0T1F5_9EURY|nr:hypothetical protein [Halovenus carboxidivorans]